jgi:NitT/TauT family transport system permease protein
MVKRLRSAIIPVVFLALFLLAWEFVISNQPNVDRINAWLERWSGWNPSIRALPSLVLPRPSMIYNEFMGRGPASRGGPEWFWAQTQSTLIAAGLGFVLGNLSAIVLATIFLYVKPLERALLPIALAIRSVPLVAVTPLLLRVRFSIADLPAVQSSPLLYAIFGTEVATEVFIVVLICFFPTLVNVAQGLESVELPTMELMHSLSASAWQIFWKVRVPTALPLLFAALKITATSSVLGAVVAEWLSSARGLGHVIYRSNAQMQRARMWVAMFISTAVSIVVFWLMGVFEKLALPWRRVVVHLRGALEADSA